MYNRTTYIQVQKVALSALYLFEVTRLLVHPLQGSAAYCSRHRGVSVLTLAHVPLLSAVHLGCMYGSRVGGNQYSRVAKLEVTSPHVPGLAVRCGLSGCEQ
jgi:hypothetical protein